MKRLAVIAQDRSPGWPGRVIAHALWARKRGRGPSMPYRKSPDNIYRDPRTALRQALADLGFKTLDEAQASGLFQPHIIALDMQGWDRIGRTYFRRRGAHVFAYELGGDTAWGFLVAAGYTGWPLLDSPYGKFAYRGSLFPDLRWSLLHSYGII